MELSSPHPRVEVFLFSGFTGFPVSDGRSSEPEKHILKTRFVQFHALYFDAAVIGESHQFGDFTLAVFDHETDPVSMTDQVFHKIELAKGVTFSAICFHGYHVRADKIFQIPRCIQSHNFTLVNDADAVAQVIRFIHIVCGEYECGFPRFFELHDVIPDPSPGLGVQTECGFVEKQHLGGVHEPPGDFQPPLHAPGIGLHKIIGPVRQFDQIQNFPDAFMTQHLFHAVHPAVEIEIFAPRELPVERGFLKHHADAVPHAVPIRGDIVSGHTGRSRCRFEKRGQHAHGCGLAGPVGPQQAEPFSRFHIERDPVHSRDGFEFFNQLLYVNHILKSFVPLTNVRFLYKTIL
jgi:hypothetical protein